MTFDSKRTFDFLRDFNVAPAIKSNVSKWLDLENVNVSIFFCDASFFCCGFELTFLHNDEQRWVRIVEICQLSNGIFNTFRFDSSINITQHKWWFLHTFFFFFSELIAFSVFIKCIDLKCRDFQFYFRLNTFWIIHIILILKIKKKKKKLKLQLIFAFFDYLFIIIFFN